MTAAFGLLIAALGKRPTPHAGYAIWRRLFMVMLGGAWVPMFVFPAMAAETTVIVPTRWAIDGFDAMTWRGLGFCGAGADWCVTGVYGVVWSGGCDAIQVGDGRVVVSPIRPDHVSARLSLVFTLRSVHFPPQVIPAGRFPYASALAEPGAGTPIC